MSCLVWVVLVLLGVFVTIAFSRLARAERRLAELDELKIEVFHLKAILRRSPAPALPAEGAPAEPPPAEPERVPSPPPRPAAAPAGPAPPSPPRPAPALRPAPPPLHPHPQVARAAPPPAFAREAPAAPVPPAERAPTGAPVRPARPAPLLSGAAATGARESPVPGPAERAVAAASVPGGAAVRRRGGSVEELLAGQLFLRIGVAIVVLGVAFFLGYALKHLGPPFRVAIGYLGGVAMLAGGLHAERRERYRTFGRAILAGGWAILYFVTFALHFLPAARILASQPLGILALLAAGVATVLFSLRYRSEWTTLAAFLLIFLALFIAAVQLDAPLSLVATVVVAGALSALSWRLSWARLLGLGAPATWAVVAVLLVPHILGLAPGAVASPWVLLGLAVPWLSLQAPVLARGGADPQADRWHAAATLSGLAAVVLALLYVHATGGATWVVSLVSALLYLASGWRLARTGRRPLYLLSATAALLFLALTPALFLGASSRWLTLFWVLEAEMVLATGVLLRERYFRWVSYLGFLGLAVDLLAARLSPYLPGGAEAAARMHLPLLGATIALALADVYLLRRPWRPALTDAERPAAPGLFSALASVLLLVLIWLDVPDLWRAPVLAGLALAWTAVAVRFGFLDFLWESVAWVAASAVAIAATNLSPEADLAAWASAGPVAIAAALLFPVWILLRRARAERLPEHLSLPLATIVSAVATGLLVALLFDQLPGSLDPWKPAFCLALGTVYLTLALATGWRELLFEGCALGGIGSLAAPFLAWPHQGELAGISLRSLALAAALVPLYASYLVLRRHDGRRVSLQATFPTAVGHGAVATVLLVVLVSDAVPEPWRAGTFAALGTLHLFLGLRFRRGELFAEGGLLSAAGLVAVAAVSWRLDGVLLGLPARTVSVVAALVPLFLAELLLRHHGRGPGDRPVFALLLRGALASLATVSLLVATFIAALLVKVEALAFGKNLFVAPVWGLAGAVYLEVGRLRRSREWHLAGHALLTAGTVHLFLVNFLQTGDVGGVSWRLVTVVPFLGLLAWVYLGWRGSTVGLELPARFDGLRHAYLYGMVAVAAVLLLYELERSWVAAAWAALGLGVLLLWRATGDVHWRLSGTVLAVATAVRGFGVNLHLRDEILGHRLNLTVVPLACLLLFAGYLLLRQRELSALSPVEGRGRALGTAVRWTWLISFLALLNAFLWVEAAGTPLTVWWSLEGLALVGLGIVVRERLARQLGLALLSFCVLKLFVYDLRGLGGLMRILSFIVLGLVLIAVSFTYTRFRERWKEIL